MTIDLIGIIVTLPCLFTTMGIAMYIVIPGGVNWLNLVIAVIVTAIGASLSLKFGLFVMNKLGHSNSFGERVLE